MAMLFYVGWATSSTRSLLRQRHAGRSVPKHWVLSIVYSLAVFPAVALLWPAEILIKFAVAFGVSGVYMGVWETVEDSTAATMLPAETRGTGFGLLSSVNGIGDLISSALVGVLWVKVSPLAAMLYVIATSLSGAAMIAWAGHKAAEA
jgi:hypothetical protein